MANYDYRPRYDFDNYSVVLPYENLFDSQTSTVWMQHNWTHSLTASALYVFAIFTGRKVRCVAVDSL